MSIKKINFFPKIRGLPVQGRSRHRNGPMILFFLFEGFLKILPHPAKNIFPEAIQRHGIGHFVRPLRVFVLNCQDSRTA